jgi:DNA-binding transcriptional regulator YiaG
MESLKGDVKMSYADFAHTLSTGYCFVFEYEGGRSNSLRSIKMNQDLQHIIYLYFSIQS